MSEPLPAPVLARPPAGAPGFHWEPLLPRQAVGTSISHHGEILQGGFPDADGRMRAGLVTLPRFDVRAEVTFTLGGDELTVEPAWKVKARRAAELTLAVLGREGAGGTLRVSDAIPVGHGFGSSSSDVVAAIRATAASSGVVLPADVVARLAVRAEAASDSVMLEGRTVLFAQREGRVIEDLGPSLPALEVVGFPTDAGGGGQVLTLDLPVPDYTGHEIELFRLLLGALRRAVTDQSAELLGRVATASARINQRHLPVPDVALWESLAGRCGAVGLQVAHSGTVAGLLFDRAAPDVGERTAAAHRLLADLGVASWQFHTGAWVAA